MVVEAWEYSVATIGSRLRSPKDEQLTDALQLWGQEGWELVTAFAREGSQAVTLVARRRLSRDERRRRSRPGESW
jgi:hypothetical protein